MRLQETLFHIALVLTAGCGSSGRVTAGTEPEGGTDAGDAGKGSAGDAAADAPAVLFEGGCGGCGCGDPSVPEGDATPAEACKLARLDYGTPSGPGDECNLFCSTLNPGTSGGYFCTLPSDYVTAYKAVQDGGSEDGGTACPVWNDQVVVQCSVECLGRRTAGIAEPTCSDGAGLGAIFEARAYLEEVSVYAFARLERELAAHGAPEELLRGARRARRDEVRHTALMARFARRFGGSPRSPSPPAAGPARTLLAIATENAVEGCVRETYGAVVGLVEARSSSDAAVRQAMERVGADECAHAELAWSVARWILPRLAPSEREQVRLAAQEAIAALAVQGDARVVALLEEQVWSQAA